MQCDIGSFIRRLSVLGLGIILIWSIFACQRVSKKSVTARTAISGTVNGQTMQGKVLATIDPDRGGKTACEFSTLPKGFNPGTFGTHT